MVKISDYVNAMALGDFASALAVKSEDGLGRIANQLNIMKNQVRDMLMEILGGNDLPAAVSVELSAVSKQMSAGAEETSSHSNTVATAAEEMTATMELSHS